MVQRWCQSHSSLLIMCHIKFYIICVFGLLLQNAMANGPTFRILAPAFVCPKDRNAVIQKPDNTVVTLQTGVGVHLNYTWVVEFMWCIMKFSQRFTLMVWESVRNLQKKLNKPQLEPGVYVINHTQLISGVTYKFIISATAPNNPDISTKSFIMDNADGHHKLLLEGRSEMLSIELVGSDFVYVDMEYLLEAIVNTCGTNDYHFVWTVESGDHILNVSLIKGSQLVISPHSLKVDRQYDVLCRVFQHSTGKFITENSYRFNVVHREINVHFNVDTLVVSIVTPFGIQANINTFDYLLSELSITLTCKFGGEFFTNYTSDVDGYMIFPTGVPYAGEYIVTVTVTPTNNKKSTSIVRILAVDIELPFIDVSLKPRHPIEETVFSLFANVTYMVPGCFATWYYTDQDNGFPTDNLYDVDSFSDAMSSYVSSAPITFHSKEVTFLGEIVDYTNETTWMSIEASLKAISGTVRIAVKCECSTKTDTCYNRGIVFADVKLKVNERPGDALLLVYPETGTAMETIFRIRSRAIIAPQTPLRYTFFCDLGNNEVLLLGSYLEYLMIETLLPYVVDGTAVWVRVCDSKGACTDGPRTVVELSPGEARTIDVLLNEVHMFVERCELMLLWRLAKSAVTTYNNTGQTREHSKFITNALEFLVGVDEICSSTYSDIYKGLISWFKKF